MDITQMGILALIKSAVTQAPQSLPEGFELEAAYPQICRHQIPTLAFEGALLCGISKENPAMRKLFQSYCKAIAITEGQIRETGRILAAFEEAGIHYMPLKGYNMRPRYPKPELRLMGDTDILIRMEQYGKIAPIMEELGYARKVESDHEFIWEKPALNVELHKRIVPSYNKDLYDYFGTGWDFSARQEGFCHTMTPEDEFVYLFAHFAKHYRGGGIGCRHITDLWVFLSTNPDLNTELVREKMDKLGLTEFYENIRRLIGVWFEDAPADAMTDFITEYLFHSGSWGCSEELLLSEGLRNTAGTGNAFLGRFQYVWKTLFPNLISMRSIYPVLNNAPWLLPVMWLWRLLGKVRVSRKTMEIHKDNLSMLSTDKLRSRRQALRYVGLDFD